MEKKDPFFNIFSTGAEKLFYFTGKISDFYSQKTFIPIALEIQPCGICNHHCKNCQSLFNNNAPVQSSLKTSYHLDLSLLKTIWDYPPDGVIISGNEGDPLIYKDIVTLMNTIALHRIPFVVITNGSNLNKKLNHIIISYSNGIRISLDATNYKTYNIVHGVGKSEWEKVIQNIRNIVKQKSNGKKELRRCKIGIGFLTNYENQNEIIPAVLLANDLGVDYVHFRPYHYSNFNPLLKIEEIKKLKLRNNFSVYFSYQKYRYFNKELKVNIKSCLGSFFYTTIDYSGDIYVCCHHVNNAAAKIGSLSENSWIELCDYKLKQRIANKFPNKDCIPFCRLFTHNMILSSQDEQFFIRNKKERNRFNEYSHNYFL